MTRSEFSLLGKNACTTSHWLVTMPSKVISQCLSVLTCPSKPDHFRAKIIYHLNHNTSEWKGVLSMAMPGQQAYTGTVPWQMGTWGFALLLPFIQQVLRALSWCQHQERNTKLDTRTLSPAGASSCSTVCLLQSQDFSYTYTVMSQTELNTSPQQAL